ncbi:hypothetical protein PV458_25935 [Streptomyces sp. MN03-5084-2B]|nr:hypothetical protein [Streptomyces sp. MN03-5084-2B]
MRFILKNEHESPVELIAEQAEVHRLLAPGQELVVEWTWSGRAALTCATGRLTLSVPPGGTIEVTEPAPGDAMKLWGSEPLPGGTAVHEFGIHNATGEPLDTFWEPWCGEGDIPPNGDPMRVEWTENSTGAGIAYHPGLVVLWDVTGSCRAWQPDGTEVGTGGFLHGEPRDEAG